MKEKKDAEQKEHDRLLASELPAAGAASSSGASSAPAAPGAKDVSADAAGGAENTAGPTWRAIAERTVKAHVHLVVEPAGESTLCNMMSEPVWYDVRGIDGSNHVAFHYAVPLSNEPITAPHIRNPPFRKEHATKMIKACLKARDSKCPDKISPGDMFLLMDGKPAGRLSQ